MPAPAAVRPPPVRLGVTAPDGIAASIFALVERGVERRPAVALQVRGEVELRFLEDLSPVRLAFAADEVLVEDGAGQAPDLVIVGRLPHIVALTTAPLLGGVPNPASRRGRAALAQVANGRVKVSGDRALGRRLLRVMAL
jgi:hypothetical protein